MLQMININVRNVLKNLNCAVRKHEFVLITGDNGAGKTTMFNTISGCLRPESGTILLDGQDITRMPAHGRTAMISSVLQDPRAGTVGRMTIRENLHMAYLRGKRRGLTVSNLPARDCLYAEKLKTLSMNLENRLDDYVSDLSGGQRQALSILMSLLSDSKLLLLDEITASLDQRASENIIRIIRELIISEKKTCLMITHNIGHLGSLGDKVFVLRNGVTEEKRGRP
ncbi:MAG: ATP-binding cassette domain-containing protein [Holosporaceae bacterium]|jgi:putative ABC transport system ATP-binding protein|nr:ATP-binding cassette domain-containing protein [Holosporaceae bacterium]